MVFCIGSFDGVVSQQRAMVEGVVIACAYVTIRFRSLKPLLGRQCGSYSIEIVRNSCIAAEAPNKQNAKYVFPRT